MRVELKDAAPRDYQQPDIVTTLSPKVSGRMCQLPGRSGAMMARPASVIQGRASSTQRTWLLQQQTGMKKNPDFCLLLSFQCFPIAEPKSRVAGKGAQ